MKTSAGRRSEDDEKVTRRLQLVRTPCTLPEKPDRRFKIGLADNLFAKDADPDRKPISDLLTETDLEPASKDLCRTDILIGITALAGLALGYLIGKSRK